MDTLSPRADDGKPPAEPGIYKITCLTTSKFYLGSTVNLRRRKKEHFTALRHNKHHSQSLQRAWNKYGEQAFTFEVVELVLPVALASREEYWFKKLKPFSHNGYNIAINAEAPMRGRKQTPEAIEKTRQAKLGTKHTPEQLENMRQAMLGKKHTPESIEKWRQARLGYRPTPETIEKMRQAKLGKKHTPEAIEKNRQARLGKPKSPEAIEKQRRTMTGRKPTPETIEKLRQANLGKPGRKHTPEEIEKQKQAQLRKKLSGD
jgi:group I intron endonuclease